MHDTATLPTRRRDAKALGIFLYFPGRECARGHIAAHYVTTGGCTMCSSIRHATLKAKRDSDKRIDPILQLSSTELSYIAGIIDGEGSIFAACVGPKRKTVYPIVCVAMTHLPLIQWLCTRMKSGTVKNHTSRNRKAHYKPMYRFQLFGKRAKLLCEALLPYLRIKGQQASLVIQFPDDQKRGPGITLDENVNAERYRLRDTLNALNH